MKRNSTMHYHSAHYIPLYPNEADTNYYKKKFLEALAGVASGIGLTLSIVMLAQIM